MGGEEKASQTRISDEELEDFVNAWDVELLKGFRNIIDNPSCVSWVANVRPGTNPKFQDKEFILQALDQIEAEEEDEYCEEDSNEFRIHECQFQIHEEVRKSQKCSRTKHPAMPLCVPFEDKEKVKKLGAIYCPETKTWFWPFDKNRAPLKEWLPLFYREGRYPPYISPRLVPRNLWGINLRSELSRGTWDYLRKQTCARFGHRCRVCGCKSESRNLDCDELWVYSDEIWGYNADDDHRTGTVYFDGLVALCENCHRVKDFGKASCDGLEDQAIARMMYLNDWSLEETEKCVTEAFKIWNKRSQVDWSFDFSLLESEYGIELYVDDVDGLDPITFLFNH